MMKILRDMVFKWLVKEFGSGLGAIPPFKVTVAHRSYWVHIEITEAEAK